MEGEGDSADTDVDQGLQEFPHSFQLEIGHQRSQLKRQETLEENALQAGHYKTPYEEARARNLLSFVYFRLHRGEEALQQAERVLQIPGQERNLVSLANKAYILHEMGRSEEAKLVRQQLNDLKRSGDFQELHVTARSELAESYGRLGRHVSGKAIKIFREVIEGGQQLPELWEWKLGLAKTLTKGLSFQNVPYTSEGTKPDPAEPASLLMEVIHNSESNRLKAKAYAELAYLLFDFSTKVATNQIAQMTSEDACKRALELMDKDDPDTTVLRSVARQYRYRNQLYTSLQLLRRAANIRKDSTILHDLGLTYKALAWQTKRDKGQLTGVRGSPDFPELSDQNLMALMKVVKVFPADKYGKFSPEDDFIKEAMDSFRQAVRLSHEENTRAAYDLASLHRSLGQLDKALAVLKTICDKCERLNGRKGSVAPLDVINACELSGFILIEQSKNADSADEKVQKHREGMTRLNDTLNLLSNFYSSSKPLGEHIEGIWHSMAICLDQIEQSDNDEFTKIKNKLKLLMTLKRPRDLRQMVHKMKELSMITMDSEGLRLAIDYHVKQEEYGKAETLLNLMLKDMAPDNKKALLQQGLIQKVYIEAGRQQLFNHGTLMPVEHSSFARAFRETFSFLDLVLSYDGSPSIPRLNSVESPNDEERVPYSAPHSPTHQEGNDDDDSSDDDTEEDDDDYFEDDESGEVKWDVMVLNDHECQKKARRLCTNLQMCGLRVTRMSRDVRPGQDEKEAMLQNMRSSRAVLVLLQTENSLMSNLNYCILHAATDLSLPVFVLKIKENCAVPTRLRVRPSSLCPPALWRLCKVQRNAVKSDQAISPDELSQNSCDASDNPHGPSQNIYGEIVVPGGPSENTSDAASNPDGLWQKNCGNDIVLNDTLPLNFNETGDHFAAIDENSLPNPSSIDIALNPKNPSKACTEIETFVPNLSGEEPVGEERTETEDIFPKTGDEQTVNGHSEKSLQDLFCGHSGNRAETSLETVCEGNIVHRNNTENEKSLETMGDDNIAREISVENLKSLDVQTWCSEDNKTNTRVCESDNIEALCSLFAFLTKVPCMGPTDKMGKA